MMRLPHMKVNRYTTNTDTLYFIYDRSIVCAKMDLLQHMQLRKLCDSFPTAVQVAQVFISSNLARGDNATPGHFSVHEPSPASPHIDAATCRGGPTAQPAIQASRGLPSC